MKKSPSQVRKPVWCASVVLALCLAGCGGNSRDPILGNGFVANPVTRLPGTPFGAVVLPGAAGATIQPGQVIQPNQPNQPVQPALVNLPNLPPLLASAVTFGIFGGSAGMTNQGILTVVNGDIGTTAVGTSSITGFHDSPPSDFYTETGANQGKVTGKIYTCTVSTTGPTSAAVNPVSCTKATNALADARVAYNALKGLPAGSDPSTAGGNLGGLRLAPGVYTAAGSSFRIQNADLTLDAQGDANAVFVFQMATTLTVGGPGAAFPQQVKLVNGALAKNVYWQVGSAATINAAGGGEMSGTIIAEQGVTVSTAGTPPTAVVNGRALSLNASVTLVDTVITVPAP